MADYFLFKQMLCQLLAIRNLTNNRYQRNLKIFHKYTLVSIGLLKFIASVFHDFLKIFQKSWKNTKTEYTQPLQINV